MEFLRMTHKPCYRLATLISFATATLTCAVAHGTESTQPVIDVGNESWFTYDNWRRLVIFYRGTSDESASLRVPDAENFSLNVQAPVLCGRNINSLWSIQLSTGKLNKFGISTLGLQAPQTVVASRAGACASPIDNKTLAILRPNGNVVRVPIDLPTGQQDFKWQEVLYDDSHDAFLAVGRTSIARIDAQSSGVSVKATSVDGETREGAIADTHLSSLRCCGEISQDGNTLFNISQLGDEDRNDFDGLAAIDIATGKYKRMYLPYSPQWRATGRQIYSLDAPYTLVGSSRVVAVSNGSLLLPGWAAGKNEDSKPALFRVDTRTGRVDRVSVVDSGILGASGNSELLFFRDGENGTRAVNSTTGKSVRKVAGEFAGAAQITARISRMQKITPASAVSSANPKCFTPTGLDEYGWTPEMAASFAKWLHGMSDLNSMRTAINHIQFIQNDKRFGNKYYIDMSELICLYQKGYSVTEKKSAEDVSGLQGKDWATFVSACDEYARSTKTPDGAFLHCVLAPF